jgi:hypothetical protein
VDQDLLGGFFLALLAGPLHEFAEVKGSPFDSIRPRQTVQTALNFPDTEEATSSNLVPPTRQNAVLRASGFTPMRHPCVSSRVRAPLPRLDYAVVSVSGQVGIPLSRPVALVPEQIPDVGGHTGAAPAMAHLIENNQASSPTSASAPSSTPASAAAG